LNGLARFITASRAFGVGVAMRVAYSRIRGMIWRDLALPEVPAGDPSPRELSILLRSDEHDAATLGAVVEAIASRGRLDWEICLSARLPAQPQTARALACLRATHPWIRVVSTDQSVDEATAARWIAEQATGEFVALLSAGCRPDAQVIEALLAGLRAGTGQHAAVLVESGSSMTDGPSSGRLPGVRLVVQRKSAFLAFLPRSHISATALAGELDPAGVSVVRTCALQQP